MSYEVQRELPPPPQFQVYGDAPEQTSELDEHHDDGAYDVDDQPSQLHATHRCAPRHRQLNATIL